MVLADKKNSKVLLFIKRHQVTGFEDGESRGCEIP